MLKLCLRCNEEKNTSSFWRNKTSKDGLQQYCITCQKEHNNRYAQDRKRNGPTIKGRDSKVCRLCNNQKPISQFGKRTGSADGKLSYCKPCWYQYVLRANAKSKKQ